MDLLRLTYPFLVVEVEGVGYELEVLMVVGVVEVGYEAALLMVEGVGYELEVLMVVGVVEVVYEAALLTVEGVGYELEVLMVFGVALGGEASSFTTRLIIVACFETSRCFIATNVGPVPPVKFPHPYPKSICLIVTCSLI